VSVCLLLRPWRLMANMKSTSERRTPVLIVGGGPVGISLAMELACWNVESVLVNERPTTSLHPKGSTLKQPNDGTYAKDGASGGN